MAAAVRGLARRAVWSWTASGITSLTALFLIGFTLRHVTAAEYGTYVFANAVVSLLTLVDVGLGMSVVRSVALERGEVSDEEKANARRTTASAHASYCALGALAFVVTLAIGPALSWIGMKGVADWERLEETLLLLGIANAITLASSSIAGVLKGRLNFSLLAMTTVTAAAVNVLVSVVTIPSLHVVGLGVAAVSAAIIPPCLQVLWVRRHVTWFRLRPSRPEWSDVKRTLRFAGPLVVIAVASRVIGTSDVLVIGAVASAATVTLYKVGSAVPNGAISLLYSGFDVIFPTMARSTVPHVQEEVCGFVTRVFGYVAGLTFGLLAAMRHAEVVVLLGRPSALAETVLLAFCAVWLINMSTHGTSLLLIARARQRRLTKLVATEATANLALTVVLTTIIGPIGAVVATLVTIAVSNWVVFPFLLRNEVAIGSRVLIFKYGVLSEAAGVATAVALAVMARRLSSEIEQLAAAGTLAVVALLVVGGLHLLSSERSVVRAALARDAHG